MRKQLFKFKHKYFGTSLPLQYKVYNITHLLLFLVLLLSTGLVYLFLPSTKAFVSCIVISACSLFSFYEGNRTGHYEMCGIVMSCLLNFIFFPMIYLFYGEQICVIPIYFIFGLMYNILMFSGFLAYFLTFLELCVYMYIIKLGFIYLPNTLLLGRESVLDYIALSVAITLVALIGGVITRYKYKLFYLEQIRTEESYEKAIEENTAKDIFLMNMSHEIRTPMNAIIGNIDLLLSQEISDQVRDNVFGIANSCNSLLALTNEIMDMSKTAGHDMVIHNSRYDVGELIMEIINMLSVRLMDTDIEFLVDMDNKIPRFLESDPARIRQVITNVLNSSIKYTKRGHIIFRVRYDYIDKEHINLLVDIEDTGVGISKDKLMYIFEPYQLVNNKRVEIDEVNEVDFGLTICKDIISALDGDMAVTSEEGYGSIFSLVIPQKVVAEERLIEIERPDKFHVLIWENSEEVASRFVKIIEKLGIICDVVTTKQDFEDMFLRYHYTHIFVAYDRYLTIERFLNRRVKNERIVVITDSSQPISTIKKGYVIYRPVCALSIAEALNEIPNGNYIREVVRKEPFSCKGFTIMVVDDNITNLNVANGLLKKYESKIITATSGKECLRLLDNEHVDIIFLDYMMPEMDGIDTLKGIRKMENNGCDKIPVISMTANVVSGAKEMFLEEGFNDYIPKPIEIEKIEKVLRKYLVSNKNSFE